jgi:hypothetical protein
MPRQMLTACFVSGRCHHVCVSTFHASFLTSRQMQSRRCFHLHSLFACRFQTAALRFNSQRSVRTVIMKDMCDILLRHDTFRADLLLFPCFAAITWSITSFVTWFNRNVAHYCMMNTQQAEPLVWKTHFINILQHDKRTRWRTCCNKNDTA